MPFLPNYGIAMGIVDQVYNYDRYWALESTIGTALVYDDKMKNTDASSYPKKENIN